MAKYKGLGRGLDALLVRSDDSASNEALQTVSIDRVQSGKYQPRTRMDQASLGELAASLKAQGMMQPILVRPVPGGRFEIIAGERRWRAAQIAGLKDVPALVRDVPDQAALAMALIENIQRENLNPLEEAHGIKRLIDDFGLTHDAAAEAVGRSRSAVSNLLRLVQLAKPVQEQLLTGALDMGHARALLSLDAGQQVIIAGKVVTQSLSVRDTERLVHATLNPQKNGTAARRRGLASDPDSARLAQELSEFLGATVRLEAMKKGAGRIVIEYANLDQLEGLLQRLR